MLKRSLLTAVLGLLLCVCLPASSAPPKDDKPTYLAADTPNVLKGLKEITVNVERLPKDLQTPSLSVDAIRSAVELKLKQNGLHIIAAEEARQNHAPTLYINLNGFKAINNLFVYNITLALQEDASPQRTRNVVVTGVSVWQRGFIGAAGELNLPAIKSDVIDDIDSFINDYQAVNPQ